MWKNWLFKMRQPWVVKPAATPTPELITVAGGHRLVAQLLAQRGLDTPEKAAPFLDPNQYTPAPPSALIGVESAAELLQQAIADAATILVWGDFDVDGQTSTALLVTALRTLAGERAVRYHVPNRLAEGHGIRVAKLREILDADDTIQLLLTCDTGIAEAEAVGFAKDRGLIVIVTDHHDLPAEFQALTPNRDPLWGLDAGAVGARSVRRADAIVNPKFLPEGDPLRTLPGVGVGYKLMQRLYELAGRSAEADALLDLVALGIVADVAEQVNDARYLLQRGLERLRTTQRFGLLTLMEVARVTPAALTAESIGFQLGPRMNALGRLDDATVAIELLTTRDVMRASQLSGQLERLNRERRLLTSQITQSALEMVDRDPSLLQFNALVLSHWQWHPGVVGIVASRMVEEFGKPAVLLLNPPGEPARGSARSVPGVDIGAAIAACSHLLLSHGGHPGAAGLSLLAENIAAFRRELSRAIPRYRDDTVETGLLIDAELEPQMLSLELAEALAVLAPFGQGNPVPRFISRDLEIVQERRMGQDGAHRKLSVRKAGSSGAAYDVVWFGGGDAELVAGAVDLVYTLSVNEYRGERSLQLMYIAHRPAEAAAVPPTLRPQPSINVVDLRRHAQPVQQIPANAAWYAEGALLGNGAPQGIAYAPRHDLVHVPAGTPLVLWSTPPSPDVLHWMMATVVPEQVYLCVQTTTDDNVPEVLRAVASMCKYALGRNGSLDVARMAARIAVPESLVRKCLLWLQARNDIQIVEWGDGDSVQITAGGIQRTADLAAELQEEVTVELFEVRAYRRFLQTAPVGDLAL